MLQRNPQFFGMLLFGVVRRLGCERVEGDVVAEGFGDQPRILAAADDGGRRYEAFWEWVSVHDPLEPSWQLDTIAVAPERQGRGIGRGLVEAGLARARADGTSAFLSTGTRANVAIHGRCGFHVYHEADAPDGGPRIWFMRWDP